MKKNIKPILSLLIPLALLMVFLRCSKDEPSTHDHKNDSKTVEADHGNHEAHSEEDGHENHDEQGDHNEVNGHDGHDDHDDHDEEGDKHEEHEEDNSHEGHDAHGGQDERGSIKLSPEVMKEFGIEIGAVTSGVIEQSINLPGEVVVNEDNLAHIVPRYAGIVKKVIKKIGDWVDKDEVIAVIESNESLGEYTVKSLIAGRVIEKHITLGEAVNDGTSIYTIANLRNVWVNLSAYQSQIPYLKIGQNAEVSLAEMNLDQSGKISYIDPVVNESTRTALVRIVLANKLGKWRPGLFVNAKVGINAKKVEIAIPKSALMKNENKSVVFAYDEDGFEPIDVTTGEEGIKNIEIKSGLKVGMKIAVKGAFIVKSELAKSEFGHAGHAH